MDDFVKGPGIWRLNTHLLANSEVCEKVHDKIQELKLKCKHLSSIEWWEEMKIETKMIFKQEGKKLGNRNKNIDKLCQINNELRKKLIVNEGKDA